MTSVLNMGNANHLILYQLHVILKKSIFAAMNLTKKQTLIGQETKEALFQLKQGLLLM
jgi:hypothetical protein